MKRGWPAIGLLAFLGYAAPAAATDYIAPRLDTGLGHGGRALYELGVGADVDFFAEYLGGRLGAVLSLQGFFGESSSKRRLLLAPELSAHFGADGDALRLFVVLQPQLGLAGFGTDASFFQGVRAGPQIEWRDTPSGLRIGLGLLYAPSRGPRGQLDWTAAALRVSVAYAFGTGAELREPEDERCPDGLPALEGYGCNPPAH